MNLNRFYRANNDGTVSCFYVESCSPLASDQLDRLRWLVTETFEPTKTNTSFCPTGAVTEVGPRLSVETPFSSNAVAICRAMGDTNISRVERSLVLPGSLSEEELVRMGRLDIMTQQVYGAPLQTFGAASTPEPVRFVPILSEGIAALQRENRLLGLGMDDWDINFYTGVFTRLGRNPTDVELMHLAQANSEHSRHWYFGAKLVVDGVEVNETLFNLIRRPLRMLRNPGVTLAAFNDNAGVMTGHYASLLIPVKPGMPSQFGLVERSLGITCTAETHNHPTYISPWAGAATGPGGRIRDQSAVGRGGYTSAAVAGYFVGNLHLHGYPIPGEVLGGEVVRGQATPAEILIKGSNGVSQYGNEIGEPLIGGFTRSFGLLVAGERREPRKCVLYTGGLGRIPAQSVKKREPEVGMRVVRIGGPAYRIGVGGGSASSMEGGTNDASLDLKSVQRPDAQMGRRACNVIASCVDMGDSNPVESIHDQGAGGPSNVLSELLGKLGGRIDIAKIVRGDQSMSVLEIWVGEYQEGYGLLIKPERLREFQAICARERVNCEVVGEVTGDGMVTVVDSRDDSRPVSLNLEEILGNLPQKTFNLVRVPQTFTPLSLPTDQSLATLLETVFLLLSVGSKGFLTSKVDRSVTGLAVQQQCCGPAQIPIADVAVTADSYFGTTGAAMAIGEQPIKMLVNPAAGARMAVGEMLTNLVAAGISSLDDVRCRVNWMWPAKLPGEGARLYDAAKALSDCMVELGIAPDGGKDSLSMSTKIGGEVVKSPGSVVVLGYAPVPNIRKVLTPDFKNSVRRSHIMLIDLGQGKNRLGGSSLAQAFGQVGDEVPDMDDPYLLRRAFGVVSQLIRMGQVTAIHDRSDGGLITTVAEMCLAANCGAELILEDLDSGEDPIPALFSEELGWVIEVDSQCEGFVVERLERDDIPYAYVGVTSTDLQFSVKNGRDEILMQCPLSTLRQWWEATSSRLELEQANPQTVAAEVASHARLITPRYEATFGCIATEQQFLDTLFKPQVAILREEGTNGNREMAAACFAGGLEPHDITMSDLRDGRVNLDKFQGVVFCGGFSFADVMDSGKGWAGAIRFNPKLREMFDRFYERPDTWSLGVCNGCQLMALMGWIPWRDIPDVEQPRFIHNLSGRFESRWSTVEILPSPSILFEGMAGARLGVWVAHGEGRLYLPKPTMLQDVLDKQLAPLAYVTPDGGQTEEYPYNPNGSPLGITALCSPDGRHTAMMPHPERCFQLWQWPWVTESLRRRVSSPWLRFFQNARAWSNQNRLT